MRLLHTSDWHLGKQIRGVSRLSEFEAVLDEIVGIAREEKIDVFLLAGDVFDTFAPPPEAEKLLFETLTRLVAERVQVVILAGNHDHSQRLDALAGILRLAGIHALGSVPARADDCCVRLTSHDSEETANLIALPWVPERHVYDFESLTEGTTEVSKQYADRLAMQVARLTELFVEPGAINLFAAHMLIEGSVVGEGGGERPIHLGRNFAVKPQAFPATLQYVALGHVHRAQQFGPTTHYCGSLLQLDFGEAGQEKYVNLVELHPRQPAAVRKVPLTAGRRLRSVTLRQEELAASANQFGDDFLRVNVELEAPALNLYQQVREFLPNAVEVTPKYASQPALLENEGSKRGGLAPDELLGRYYQQRYGQAPPAALLALFNQLYAEAEADATA